MFLGLPFAANVNKKFLCYALCGKNTDLITVGICFALCSHLEDSCRLEAKKPVYSKV